MSAETAVGLAVVWPFFGVVLIALLRRWPNLRETATLLTAGSLFTIVANVILPVVMAGGRPRLDIIEVLRDGAGAQAAGMALLDNTELGAREIVEKALSIAADICIYTNHNLVIEELSA